MSAIFAILRHLERLGGIILHPRRTILAILAERPGGLTEILAWASLVSCALQPVGAGQALLLVRASPLDGVMSLVSVIASRLSLALGGVIAAAVLLALLERVRVKDAAARRGFDLALDACAYLLVPYLLLASVGQLLAASGLDLGWMPHHNVRGRFGDRLLQAAVAYGWSIGLYALLVHAYLEPRRPVDP